MGIREIEKWFKLYNNIIFIIALIIIAIYVWTNYISPSSAKSGFISSDEIKAKTAAIPPAPDKVCERAGDPSFVSQNYSVCCPADDKSPNCICRLPSIKSCQQKYKDCLSGKLLSKESNEFIGPDNLPNSCKKIMEGCFMEPSTAAKDGTGPKLMLGMKPDLSNSGNNICQVDGYKKDDLAAFCGRVCNSITGCTYYQTDDLMGSCGLYSGKPIPLEKGAGSASLGNYQLYSAPSSNSIKEGFAADTTSNGPAAQFCSSGAVKKCPGSKDCLCSHSIITDCQRMNNECLNTPGATQESCSAQFGACCGVLDTLDPSQMANMADKPKFGSGQTANLLCSPKVTSLDDCKKACLGHSGCRFIDSNLPSGDAGSGRQATTTGVGNCYLFGGDPSPGGKVMLGIKRGPPETIYMKQPGNRDEMEANKALAQK